MPGDRQFAVLGPLQSGVATRAFLGVELVEGISNPERPVVVVWMPDDAVADERLRARVERETAFVTQLRHPNLINVHGLFRFEEGWARIVEFVDGEPLSRILRDLRAEGRSMPPALAARILVDACEGVQFAHDEGTSRFNGRAVVHGGLRPDTLMLAFDGRVLVTGYGASVLAPARDGAPVPEILAYLAPEQILGGRATGSPATDVYALGTVLYELLADKPPFADAEDVENAILASPPAVIEMEDVLGRQLGDVAARAMAKRGPDRFDSVDALKDAVLEALADASMPLPASVVLAEVLADLIPGGAPERRGRQSLLASAVDPDAVSVLSPYRDFAAHDETADVAGVEALAGAEPTAVSAPPAEAGEQDGSAEHGSSLAPHAPPAEDADAEEASPTRGTAPETAVEDPERAEARSALGTPAGQVEPGSDEALTEGRVRVSDLLVTDEAASSLPAEAHVDPASSAPSGAPTRPAPSPASEEPVSPEPSPAAALMTPSEAPLDPAAEAVASSPSEAVAPAPSEAMASAPSPSEASPSEAMSSAPPSKASPSEAMSSAFPSEAPSPQAPVAPVSSPASDPAVAMAPASSPAAPVAASAASERDVATDDVRGAPAEPAFPPPGPPPALGAYPLPPGYPPAGTGPIDPRLYPHGWVPVYPPGHVPPQPPRVAPRSNPGQEILPPDPLLENPPVTGLPPPPDKRSSPIRETSTSISFFNRRAGDASRSAFIIVLVLAAGLLTFIFAFPKSPPEGLEAPSTRTRLPLELVEEALTKAPAPAPQPPPTASTTVAAAVAGPALKASPAAPKPPPAAGEIVVGSEPPVRVFVADQSFGRTPATISLPAGEHQVRLTDAETGINAYRTIRIRAGRRTTRLFRFRTCQLDVEAPDGAVIKLNARKLGTAPLREQTIYEGRYLLRVSYEGKVWSKKIVAPPGGRLSYQVRVKDAPL